MPSPLLDASPPEDEPPVLPPEDGWSERAPCQSGCHAGACQRRPYQEIAACQTAFVGTTCPLGRTMHAITPSS